MAGLVALNKISANYAKAIDITNNRNILQLL